MHLLPTSFEAIKASFEDFQSKQGTSYEPPRAQSPILGIYEDTNLIGYFILWPYDDGDLEINQGYLAPTARHKRLSKQAMTLLEASAKKSGFKRIILAAQRSLKAYVPFMEDMGYKPQRIVFSKEL